MKVLVVYDGTDAVSAASIIGHGLNNRARRKAAGAAGVDDKGFSVTTDLAIAKAWAKVRAAERGSQPVVLQAQSESLLLRQPDMTALGDPGELFIATADFRSVGPGVFQLITDN